MIDVNTRIVAFDTETNGLNSYKGARPFCISFTDNDMNDLFFRWDYNKKTRQVSIDEQTKSDIKDIFSDSEAVYIAHNAKFDLTMLASIGINIDLNKIKVWDTVVLAHVENNARPNYKLKPLCNKLLDFPEDDEKDLKKSVIKARVIGKKLGWKLGDVVEEDYALAEPDICKKYAIGDTQRCMLLYKYLISKLDAGQFNVFEMEMELMKVLLSMEQKGISIDIERANELETYYSDIIEVGTQIKKELNYENLNTRSPKQMHDVFYSKLNAPPVYTMSKDKNKVKTKKLTTNKLALNKWAETIPLARAIVDVNIAEHELGSFVKPLKDLVCENGRVHPNYKQTGAVTGRLSCTNPNLQNISNVKDGVKGRVKLRARELFIPQKDHVLYFPDYSQIEIWISAFCSQDPVMCSALREGLDMHAKFNEKFYGQRPDFSEKKDIYRKQVKQGVFCTLYGGGADALCGALGCSKDEAYDFLDLFKETYKGLNQYGKDLMYVAKEYGYIENPFGRKYNVNEDIAYKSLNYMIQGSAAEVMKRALININKLLTVEEPHLNNAGCNLLLTIHDEVCIEVPEYLHSESVMKKIVKAMQGNLHDVFGMPRPFDVSMAWTNTRWSEKKEIKL